uniref:Transmembrane protein n=1 Tax=Cannabis sativa TaxID=3483 RepID=A0A803R8Z8_CANSA
MFSMPSLWFGCSWLDLGSVDGLVSRISLGKSTRLDSLPSATNANPPFPRETPQPPPPHRTIFIEELKENLEKKKKKNKKNYFIFCTIHGAIVIFPLHVMCVVFCFWGVILIFFFLN